MEKKALVKLEKQISKDPTSINIENLYLIKIPSSIKEKLEEYASTIKVLSFNGCKLTSL